MSELINFDTDALAAVPRAGLQGHRSRRPSLDRRGRREAPSGPMCSSKR
jgi:hypothetical protein